MVTPRISEMQQERCHILLMIFFFGFPENENCFEFRRMFRDLNDVLTTFNEILAQLVKS
jgi:hypothetical protein